jgi:hypothetical protein
MIIAPENSGFVAYALYNSIRLHFTSKTYDYFKYNGKTNVTKDTFAKKKDKFTFYKLSRKYSLTDLKMFYVANFLEKTDGWVNDLLSQDAEENYVKWQKVNQSLTYMFSNDLDKLLDLVDNPSDLLKVKSNEYPKLLLNVMSKFTHIETLIIMNDILNFFPMWEKKIDDTYIWPNFKMKCEKYLPFISYDKTKFKKILKDKIQNYED